MKTRDLTLGASGELQIAKLEKTRSELLKDASDSVSKLQRLLKRYEDQVEKTPPCTEEQRRAIEAEKARQRGEGKPKPTKKAVDMTEEEIKAKLVDVQRRIDALPKQPTDLSWDILYAEKQAYQEALTAKIKEGLGLEKALPKQYTDFMGECMKRTDGDMAGCVKEYKEKSKSDPDKYPPIGGEKKAADAEPEILEDMSAGGKKPVKDVSIGAGSPAPTTRTPLKPVAVLPGTDKAWTPEAREAAAEARRSKKKPDKEPKVSLQEFLAERTKKATRVGFVTAAPDDVGRPK